MSEMPKLYILNQKNVTEVFTKQETKWAFNLLAMINYYIRETTVKVKLPSQSFAACFKPTN